MAIDLYLQIEDIKGESSDSAHQGWIECMSVNWSLSQPKSATASTAGGHNAGRWKWKYTQQRIGGWDLASNRVV